MPRYRVNVTETSFGFAEVEADNEEEARAKADEAYSNGNVLWASGKFDIQEVEEQKQTVGAVTSVPAC